MKQVKSSRAKRILCSCDLKFRLSQFRPRDLLLRSYSPQITIAGGQILDDSGAETSAQRYGKCSKISAKFNRTPTKPKQIKLYLETAGEHGVTFADLQARTGWRNEILQKAIAENIEKKAVIEAESFFVARTPFENLKTKTSRKSKIITNANRLPKGFCAKLCARKSSRILPPEIFKTRFAKSGKRKQNRGGKRYCQARRA